MWALRVVVPSPLLNDDPGFIEAVEDLSVQELIAEPGIEALTISVLPRWPRFDVGGLGTDSLDPLHDRIRDELRSVIRSDVGRNTPDQKVLVIPGLWNITVCRTMLPQNTTGAAFRYGELASHQINAVATPCGA